jgi:hypothetical protein
MTGAPGWARAVASAANLKFLSHRRTTGLRRVCPSKHKLLMRTNNGISDKIKVEGPRGITAATRWHRITGRWPVRFRTGPGRR